MTENYSNKQQQNISSTYCFICFITVCSFITTILFYIVNPINFTWKQHNYNTNDDESIFLPFIMKKVPAQWRHYITNQPLNHPTHHPKLYYPRNCPNDKVTSCAKPIPSFIFAGSEWAGASFVFRILKDHPQVISAIDNSDKPTIFLDKEETENWDEATSSNVLFETYLSQFPFLEQNRSNNKNWIVGENAPQYLYKSHLTAKRIKEILPNVKLVFFLNDPISRAYSQYLHENSNLGLSFEALIDLELPILHRCGHTNVEWEKFVRCHEGSEIRAAWKVKGSNETHAFNLLAKGMYYPALIPFLERFPPSQLFIIRTEDILLKRLAIFEKLARFLEIDADYFINNWHYLIQEEFPYSPLNKQQQDIINKEKPKLSIRYRLEKVYRDLNNRLIEIFDPSTAHFNGWIYDVDRG